MRTSRCACTPPCGSRHMRRTAGPSSREWMLGRPRCGGISLKHTAWQPARRVATNLCGGEVRVPQRDDAQRHQVPVGPAAPLLDHPVVVRVDTRLAELAVLGLGEGLTAEPGERREAERHVDVVHQHVLDPGDRVVAARAHLVVGHRRHRHLVAAVADRGDVALVDVDEVLEDPAVRRSPVRGELLLVGPAADVAHRSPTSRRSIRGPRSLRRSGSHSCQRCGGSTTWSSTLTIKGRSPSRVASLVVRLTHRVAPEI